MQHEMIALVGMMGLGRRVADMVRRLKHGGHPCGVFDQSPEAVEALVKQQVDD